MDQQLQRDDVFGLLRPGVDAHTLGISAVAQLLSDCGCRSVIAGAAVCAAANTPLSPDGARVLADWIRSERITRIGFSYRLDPQEGVERFGELVQMLRQYRLLSEAGGPVRALYFAGLPHACEEVRRAHRDTVATLHGDEAPGETLRALDVPPSRWPRELETEVAYDEARTSFARDLLRSGAPERVASVDRSAYREFGTAPDTLVARLADGDRRGLPPLMRAHVGPYLPDRLVAVRLFGDWTRELASAGLLDVLSIGSSQLSQSAFGEDWGDRRNGGGVPLNSVQELRAVWEAARPMLVRTYAGTRNIPRLAETYESAIHIAWHALSLWWFSRLDGRGPYGLRENLEQHVETLRTIAGACKPFEPNVPHHFAFRGADDVTYVVSGVLAARLAKRLGIGWLVLQVMLNTPRRTWGVQDLAKARALLALARELQDDRFRVILQPRAGLDYFSPDLEKAKVQLASVSAMMDDIEPENPRSPEIIHVVSYSEGSHLADPSVVNESVRITRAAIDGYRASRARGDVENMARSEDVKHRTHVLLDDARVVLAAIERSVPDPYSPEGLYSVFAAGFLPVPHLWECRDEYPEATRWPTRFTDGGVQVVDADGKPVAPAERAQVAAGSVWAARHKGRGVSRALAAPQERVHPRLG